MRTTIRLDDMLLSAAKRRAAEEGITLTRLIDEALRARLSPAAEGAVEPYVTHTFRGRGIQSGVDLTSNAALRDLMDGT